MSKARPVYLTDMELDAVWWALDYWFRCSSYKERLTMFGSKRAEAAAGRAIEKIALERQIRIGAR